MIFRRLALHLKDQNWTAIAIEFVLLVLGVFLGMQVSNWNQQRQQSDLARSYLVRLGNDLGAMQAYLEDMAAESSARYALTLDLAQAAGDEAAGDDAMIAATEAFFTKGWKTPRFTIVNAVYSDLSSTGNLGLIEPRLRDQITTYYSDLGFRKERVAIGRDWSLPVDSRFIGEHDVYRWDQNLAALIRAEDAVKRRQTILAARADLARLATMYLYIEKSSLGDYEASLAATKSLKAALANALESEK
jgi:hypothetical protein